MTQDRNKPFDEDRGTYPPVQTGQHTPVPHIRGVLHASGYNILMADSELVAYAKGPTIGPAMSRANAARLALAWNSHDELVETCQQLSAELEAHIGKRCSSVSAVLVKARAALADATPCPTCDHSDPDDPGQVAACNSCQQRQS